MKYEPVDRAAVAEFHVTPIGFCRKGLGTILDLHRWARAPAKVVSGQSVHYLGLPLYSRLAFVPIFCLYHVGPPEKIHNSSTITNLVPQERARFGTSCEAFGQTPMTHPWKPLPDPGEV
jgi:hypothetical protein